MFEFSNGRFLEVRSDLGSQGCLYWNCPEPITNNCAHQFSKVVYNKSAETKVMSNTDFFLVLDENFNDHA
jgi:hypothetical protein